MFKVIYEKELLDKLVSLRFALVLFLSILIAIAGVVGFKGYYEEGTQQAGKYRAETEKELRAASSKALADLTPVIQTYYAQPRLEELIVAGHKNAFPNLFKFNSFVIAVPERTISSNPFYDRPIIPDWYFIVAVLFSFLTLALAYNVINGEKADGTLALGMSNPVSRSTLILAKYGALMTVMIIALMVSGLVWLISASIGGLPVLSASFLNIAIWFALFSIIYISLMALLGILISIHIKSPPAGMILMLVLWVLFTFVIPGTGRIIMDHAGEVPTRVELKIAKDQAREAIWNSIPKGSKVGVFGPPPEEHPDPEGRVRLELRLLESENRLNVDYIDRQLNQIEKTMSTLNLSPASAFRTLGESLVGTGISRFRRLNDELQIYQGILKDFLTAADARDPDSRHILFPGPSRFFRYFSSEKPVDYESIPKFKETPPGLLEGLKDGFQPLLYLVFLNLILFLLCWVSFIRADVR